MFTINFYSREYISSVIVWKRSQSGRGPELILGRLSMLYGALAREEVGWEGGEGSTQNQYKDHFCIWKVGQALERG